MRFFHKFRTLNFKYLALVNGILLSVSPIKKYTKTLQYINKYSYVLENIQKIETSNKYPDKIWQLWLQGEENMPPIVKKCTKSVKKYYSNVILLDSKNLSEYITLPDYIEEKHKKGIIPNAHYSDIIRLTLLAKYGGLWLDSTIFLTDKIPNDILNSTFFTFKSFSSSCVKEKTSIEQFSAISNYLEKVIVLESSYFLKADSENIIINAVLNLLLEYWKYEDKVVDYLMLDQCFTLAILKNSACRKQFLNIPVYYLENILVLQRALFEKFDSKLFDEIKNLTPIHKLTHKNLHRNPHKDSFLNHILSIML